jgi:curved DNA-binding protein CbpA
MMERSRHGPKEGLYLRLEVAPDSSHQEIVRAYRRLVHGAHPDARPDDSEAAQRFREITEAYDVLSDPLRRASYDRSCKPRPNPHSNEAVALGVDVPPTRNCAVALWAGPVHVQPISGSLGSNSMDPLRGPFAHAAWLLADIFESPWRF